MIDHIREELGEIEAVNGKDLMEWVDLILLSMDGAYRAGFLPEEIASGLVKKLTVNESRQWPDWRTVDPTKKIKAIKPE